MICTGQAGLAITRNKDVNITRRQFCSDLAESVLVISKYIAQLFDQGIGTTHGFKGVMEFLNLVKLDPTQYGVVGYYEHKLTF